MPLLLTCEHARPDLPRGMACDIDPASAAGHVLWDPLAFDLAVLVALGTGAPLLSGQLSRAVVDLNRRAERPDVVPATSFGQPIAVNAGLDASARQRRIAALHAPYRRAVRAEVDRAIARGGCAHISVHSFTATLDPARRSYPLSLLFDPGRPAEVALVQALGDAIDHALGVRPRLNEPYLGVDEGLTTWLREQFPDPAYAGIELELCHELAGDLVEPLAAVLTGLSF